MTLDVGLRLGPYEISGPLGAGGMGEVYKASDTRLGRTVAVKVLPSHLAGDGERRQRFALEAKAISALSHPHICVLHDVGQQDGVDYLVMEYLEGETLAARLRRGPLSSGRGPAPGRRHGRGDWRGPPGGSRPSRPQARQRHAHQGRREAHGLRPGQAAGA
jgi:serine/threonine protein kinase